ncbi:MAG: two-component sensor histidine kinase [Acidimicrobiales bacterium]|nr:MAG: two-component sensor histidine kinase [Acidimicrobiales bacterium]
MRRAARLPFRWGRRIRLRTRVVLAFTLGGLVLSGILSSITFVLTRDNLLEQRERVAISRAATNALIIRSGLDPAADIRGLLETVATPEGANPLLNYQGRWTALNEVEFGSNALPAQLREAVLDGRPARMRYLNGGRSYLALGIPIPERGAYYFEGISLEPIEDTLDSLVLSMIGATLVTTVAGALLGLYAGRAVLAPLSDIGNAARAIASGKLDVHLQMSRDPDLSSIIDAFNEMVAALAERIERDARFASEVSHELRSPLMTLSASAEVLENLRSEMPERARAALDLLVSDLDRFRKLVEDLLEMSRIDAGAVRLDMEEVVIAEVLRNATAALGRSSLPVEVSQDAAGLVVLLDRRRFAQVLANLFDNADKYAEGPVVVKLERAGERVLVAVEDDGPGVPPEERQVIFDRFSRGSAGGRRGSDTGTGLGLALVVEHMRLLGGRVWVEDRPDGRQGARFVLEFPIVTEIPVATATAVGGSDGGEDETLTDAWSAAPGGDAG